ncbi:MAG: PQQ-binding-like beta-propeller repeat protein [Planctomycetes bacterium]|nr:PQQ-binding-like beta-propeller repeat protein [Planctomycetota bacterium]
MRTPCRFLAAVLIVVAANGCSKTKVTEVSVGPRKGKTTVGDRQLDQVDPREYFIAKTRSRVSVDDVVRNQGDWPWWRGLNRDGYAVGDSYPLSWSDEKNVIWKTPIPGRGHGSPTVVGDRIFIATAEKSRNIQSVLCYDRETGKRLWRKDVHQGDLGELGDPGSSYASATLACDGMRVFALFRNDGVIYVTALDLEGNQLWKRAVGSHSSNFGFGSSPLIYRELVIIAADSKENGFIAALHRKTGEIWWKKSRHSADSYSSPVVANVAGKDQLFLSGGKRIVSYDPNTGDEIWSRKGCAEVTCGTMVWNESVVFASGGYKGNETIAVKADGSEEIVWRDSGFNFYVPSMILVDKYLYAVDRKGRGYCINADSGKVVWRHRFGGRFYSSPIYAGGQIYVTTRGGKTTVFKPDPNGFRSTSVNRLGDEMDSTIVACGGRLYIRVAVRKSGKRQEMLYCIGKKPPQTVSE